MKIEIIETTEKCCCRCKGHGEECEKFAWIYCDLRRANEDKFNADCGENLGCNHFAEKINTSKIEEWLKNTVSDLFMNFLYYDRKADEEMNVEKVRKLMDDGIISKELMIKVFTKQINGEY